MSIAGIASGALYSVLSNAGNSLINRTSSTQSNPFKQFQNELQQLGQDLQAGNLSAAQQDYATLQQLEPGGSSSSSQSTETKNPIQQAFNQLSQDLQSGNLSAAQSDFSTLQQDLQQNSSTSQVHHHHHHHGGGEQNQITQAFQSLSQALQSNNLSGAQSAFATLEQDLSQIGGFATSSSSGSSSSAQSTGSNFSVSA